MVSPAFTARNLVSDRQRSQRFLPKILRPPQQASEQMTLPAASVRATAQLERPFPARAAGKEPVLPPQRDLAQIPLRRVVVERRFGVLQKARDPRPLPPPNRGIAKCPVPNTDVAQ